HCGRAGIDDGDGTDRRTAGAWHRSNPQAGSAARPGRPVHGAAAHDRVGWRWHGWRMERHGDAAEGCVERLLEQRRRRSVYPGRLDGSRQAVLHRLHDYEHRLPCGHAHAWWNARRRTRDHQRGRQCLGRRDRRGLPGDEVPHHGNVLMAIQQAARAPLLEEAMGPGGPIVVFDDVSLAFDEKVILRNISFTLKTAHTKIFLGASAPGKSTILRLILGLLKPDSGRIFVNGDRVDNMKEDDLLRVRGDLGMVFQEGALFDSLTVRENLGYKLFEESDAPIDEVNRRVEEVLGFVRLSEFIDRMPSELSGGQRRRVAIARAMTAKPRILPSHKRQKSLT